jgi:SAM-dependent methyltransferase
VRLQNHFAAQAAEYREFRPTYPPELFDFLASVSPARQRAWDCGTGNGQAALGLAERFALVVASDATRQQITRATSHRRVRYWVALAEKSGLKDCSVDLVTVAQAVHWFDLEGFYAQVRQVAHPGGILALWCYGLQRSTRRSNRSIQTFYTDVVGPYWPKERHHVEARYRDLPFPFAEIDPPHCAMDAEWDLSRLLGYVGTWSPLKIFRRETRRDPLPALADALAEVWGPARRTRTLHFPLHLRVGRVS